MEQKNENWYKTMLTATIGWHEEVNPDLPFDIEGTVEYVMLTTLTKRQYDVLKYRTERNMTFAQIGEIMNVSGETARRITEKALAMLRTKDRRDQLTYGMKEWTRMHAEEVSKVKVDASICALNKKYNRVFELIHQLNGEVGEIKPVVDSKGRPYLNLIELELSVGTFNALYRAGITNTQSVLDREYDIINLKIRNVGKRRTQELIDKMHELGYKEFGIKEG